VKTDIILRAIAESMLGTCADIWIQPGNVLATASRCSTILAERDSFSVQSERVVQGKIFLVKA